VCEYGHSLCGAVGRQRSERAWIGDLLAFVLMVVAPASTAGLFPWTAAVVTCVLQGLAVWWFWRSPARR
jgi:hypothetical protein